MSASSTLVLHERKGTREVSFEELKEYRAPPPQGRWYPLAHSQVVTRVTETLGEAGYVVQSQKFGVTKDGHRFFGVLDLTTKLVDGVTLACGIRNSTNQTFPIGFCAGSRVFVCENLAFRSELLVRRKHTLYGERDFTKRIAGAIGALTSFRDSESDRIKRFMALGVDDVTADAIILRAYERGIVGARDLPKVIHEWRNPAHAVFQPRTAWSLVNAFTSALRDRSVKQPQDYAHQTMRLNGLLDTSAAHFALAT
jgi:uncharacterized membrane protein